MKHLLLAIALVFTIGIQAQTFGPKEIDESISFIVTQDVKLATMEDDHGNKPFTADVRVTMLWKGFQTNTGNVEIRSSFEYADLSPVKYIRYAAGAGYSFNYMTLPFTEYNYAVAPFVNYGIIVREGNSAAPGAFEFGFDLKFPVNDWLKIVSTQNWTDRNEIGKRLNTWNAFKDNFNWGVGVEVVIL